MRLQSSHGYVSLCTARHVRNAPLKKRSVFSCPASRSEYFIVELFLEAFICVGLILGLTVFFRSYCDRPGRWLDHLDGNVYGVYLVHIFVVWTLQVGILDAPLSATAKFAIATVAGLVVSFSIVAILRQIRLVRRVV